HSISPFHHPFSHRKCHLQLQLHNCHYISPAYPPFSSILFSQCHTSVCLYEYPHTLLTCTIDCLFPSYPPHAYTFSSFTTNAVADTFVGMSINCHSVSCLPSTHTCVFCFPSAV